MNHEEDFLEEENLDQESSDSLEDLSSLDEEEDSLAEPDESSDMPEEMEQEVLENSEEAPQEAGSEGKNYTWTTLKGVIAKKQFIPVMLIIGLFVLILIIVTFSYGGISGGFDYVAPKCTQMRVTLGKGENANSLSMSMDDYIISHIYSATKNLKNVNANLYRVLAITINTEVQSSGSCSWSYVPEVDDIYPFEVLSQDSEEYIAIQKSIKPVKDLVMVQKKSDTYYQTSVDGFCSNSISTTLPDDVEDDIENFDDEDNLESFDEDEFSDDDFPMDSSPTTFSKDYTIPQLPNMTFSSSWVEENVDNWNFKNCPCNNPEGASESCFDYEWNYSEDDEPDLIYVDGGSGTGISIYAAHYFTSQENKSYEGVLKAFYPNNDWELKTNDAARAPKEEKMKHQCTGENVPFESTPLSRDKFISLVTEFLQAGHYQSYAQFFIDYAGDIYDMGKRKNINPELIYIFARKETGFSVNSSDTQHYNYYGMGHGNTSSHGIFYNSFMEGVEDLFDYFVDAGSLDVVVSKYSYLGTYLANPGDSGDGGCYYLTLPEIYGPNYSRCNSSYRCASSGGGPGCVRTTDEERQAYIDWQAKKYIQHRQAIFKLGIEVCDGVVGSTDGTSFLDQAIINFLFSQGSSLDEFNEGIIEQGCKYRGTGAAVGHVAATAVAQLAEYGKKFHYVWGGMHTGQPGNYGVLANWGPSGPDCSGFVSWALYNAGFTWVSKVANAWGRTGTRVALSDERLQVGDFIVTPNKEGTFTHIVIITNVNRAEGYYNVVEAQGKATGVIFNTVPMSDTVRLGVLMSDYYAAAPKSSEFSNLCSSKGY